MKFVITKKNLIKNPRVKRVWYHQDVIINLQYHFIN